jgi:hypothetical protein
MQNARNYIENNQGLEIFTIPDFLTNEECDILCKLIEKNHTRSQVAGLGNKKTTYDKGRTSSTSTLTDSDLINLSDTEPLEIENSKGIRKEQYVQVYENVFVKKKYGR